MSGLGGRTGAAAVCVAFRGAVFCCPCRFRLWPVGTAGPIGLLQVHRGATRTVDCDDHGQTLRRPRRVFPDRRTIRVGRWVRCARSALAKVIARIAAATNPVRRASPWLRNRRRVPARQSEASRRGAGRAGRPQQSLRRRRRRRHGVCGCHQEPSMSIRPIAALRAPEGIRFSSALPDDRHHGSA